MATGKPKKESVNKQHVYDDFKSMNYNVVELVSKYQISSARIYQIVKEYEKNLEKIK